ncbi:histone H1.1, embryonic-like [Battus philenor]|uniref:histone H1.1, embryonic-like n=1 Tax=Battus philenor TaxID=42288 RepID=UPI0035D0B58D
MSEDSDIEMKTKIPKKRNKKIPDSPSEEMLKSNEEPKKLTTRVMIHRALTELKSRKGTSLYAIKKYIHEKFDVDVSKINHVIKNLIKSDVEAGTITQTKGTGASGSFKLVTEKNKVDKKKPPNKNKKSVEKTKKLSEKTEPKPQKKTKKEIKSSDQNEKKTEEVNKSEDKTKKKTSKDLNKKEKKKSRSSMAVKFKRKSIGSILKPPKMKPKAKA